jgi:hypothetical protein
MYTCVSFVVLPSNLRPYDLACNNLAVCGDAGTRAVAQPHPYK